MRRLKENNKNGMFFQDPSNHLFKTDACFESTLQCQEDGHLHKHMRNTQQALPRHLPGALSFSPGAPG